MHEIGITKNMFEIVLKEATKVSAREVRMINLVISEMTGVVGESMRFYFDFLSKGTIVEGEEVTIRMVPPMVLCRNCNMTSKLKSKTQWTGPHCQDNRLQLVSGKELIIKSIDVEQDGDKGSSKHSGC